MSALLARREDSMIACEAPWLQGFRDVPADASVPLAMSGPHPRAVGSYGAECLAWGREELGMVPRWWQALAVTRQLEHDADGALVWPEVVESGPRRIGKSVRLRLSALWRVGNAARIGEPQLAMLVSKDLAIGKEIQMKAWPWAARAGWLVTKLNGGQEIATPSGEDRWLLRAPNAVYGYDVGYGQVDEAWSVSPEPVSEGLEPALLERLWAQLHLTSTGHTRATSLMRRRLLTGLLGSDDVLLLLWGAHPDLPWSDRAGWRAASPHWTAQRAALMERKYLAAVAGEADPEIDDPDPLRGWASQYLNVWPALGEDPKQLVMPAWPSRRTEIPQGPPTAIGVGCDPDLVWVSAAVCSAGPLRHVAPLSVMRDGSPTALRCRLDRDRAYVVEQIARVQRETGAEVALDRKGPAGFLVRDLETAGVRVTVGGLDEYATACSDFDADVKSGAVVHAAYAELDAAVEAAGWRNVGDRRVWARRSGEISMLDAATWARWGSQQAAEYDVEDSLL